MKSGEASFVAAVNRSKDTAGLLFAEAFVLFVGAFLLFFAGGALVGRLDEWRLGRDAAAVFALVGAMMLVLALLKVCGVCLETQKRRFKSTACTAIYPLLIMQIELLWRSPAHPVVSSGQSKYSEAGALAPFTLARRRLVLAGS